MDASWRLPGVAPCRARARQRSSRPAQPAPRVRHGVRRRQRHRHRCGPARLAPRPYRWAGLRRRPVVRPCPARARRPSRRLAQPVPPAPRRHRRRWRRRRRHRPHRCRHGWPAVRRRRRGGPLPWPVARPCPVKARLASRAGTGSVVPAATRPRRRRRTRQVSAAKAPANVAARARNRPKHRPSPRRFRPDPARAWTCPAMSVGRSPPTQPGLRPWPDGGRSPLAARRASVRKA